MLKFSSCLYIIATPIGNLNDISFRAIDCLKTVNCIAAEDTRHSQKLLAHYGISTPMISLHQHNEGEKTAVILQKLSEGCEMALISDAGTPLISDPGAHLVAEVRAAGYAVIPVPGACAAIAALSASGLSTTQFLFYGFLPTKTQARLEALAQCLTYPWTVILYEAPHRIVQLMDELLLKKADSRHIVIARELTKTFETFFSGTVVDAKSWLLNDLNQQKGEFVVMLAGAEEQPADQVEQVRVLACLLAEMPLKSAVKVAQSLFGGERNVWYELGLQLKNQ